MSETAEVLFCSSSRKMIVRFIHRDGSQKIHRYDGPAIYFDDESFEAWYSHGKLHRIDGPAIRDGNDYRLWAIEGIVTKVEFPSGRVYDRSQSI